MQRITSKGVDQVVLLGHLHFTVRDNLKELRRVGDIKKENGETKRDRGSISFFSWNLYILESLVFCYTYKLIKITVLFFRQFHALICAYLLFQYLGETSLYRKGSEINCQEINGQEYWR